ncbi:TPA: hypothetical protein DEP96_04185 [Candidatus Uhrbacteria bacterium]|nr:hypothetical protein [Candidatus Uhrbacteria bacterium]
MIGAFAIFVYILSVLWLGVFVLNKELRKEMIILSVSAFFLAPVIVTVKGGDAAMVAERFAGVHMLDLWFAFVVAGLAGSLYHVIFGKHYHRLPKIKQAKKDDALVQLWLIRLFIGALAFMWGIVFCAVAFDLTPAPAALATGVVMSIYIIAHRHDLLVDVLLSGLITGLVAFFAGAIAILGSTQGFSSTLIAEHGYLWNVPLDLVTWSVAFGLALGPMYEYIRRLTVK